jgi:hypothetical protein
MMSSSKVSYKKERFLINGERNNSFGYRDLDRILQKKDEEISIGTLSLRSF